MPPQMWHDGESSLTPPEGEGANMSSDFAANVCDFGAPAIVPWFPAPPFPSPFANLTPNLFPHDLANLTPVIPPRFCIFDARHGTLPRHTSKQFQKFAT